MGRQAAQHRVARQRGGSEPAAAPILPAGETGAAHSVKRERPPLPRGGRQTVRLEFQLDGGSNTCVVKHAPNAERGAVRLSDVTGVAAGYLQEAEGHLAAGDLAEARAATERALERDPNSLSALRLLARIAEQQSDLDIAVHSLHRWLEVQEVRTGRKGKKARKPVHEQLEPLDTEASSWKKLQTNYANGLVKPGKSYSKKKDLLGALEIYRHLLAVAPDHPEAQKAIHRIRTKGGKEVAVEDVFAGTDPTGGMSEEDLLKLDKARWSRGRGRAARRR